MKFLIQLAVTLVLCAVLQYFLPWWTIAVAGCLTAYVVGNKGFVSFCAGFLAVALLWSAVALIIDSSNHSLLTQKINQLLPLNSFVLTAVVGGLVGGFSSLTGSLLQARK